MTSFPTIFSRGLRRKCPSCGEGSAFEAYIRVRKYCGHCSAPLAHLKADDFPAYLTIVVVGHILVPLIFLFEDPMAPFSWAPVIIWPLIALLVALIALPIIKGCVLAVLWHLNDRGSLHPDAIDESRLI